MRVRMMIVIVIMMIIIIANDISRFRLLLPPKIFVPAELSLSLSLSSSRGCQIRLLVVSSSFQSGAPPQGADTYM